MSQNFLIHADAKIHPDNTIPNNVKILQNTIIAENVSLNEDVFIGAGVTLHKNCRISPGVVIEGYAYDDHFIRYEEPKDGKAQEKAEPIPTILHQNCEINTGSRIEKGATLYPNVIIGENALIKEGTIIHENVTIGNHCIIESNVEIGKDSIISNNCTIRSHVKLYQGSTLNENVVIEKNTHFTLPIAAMEGSHFGEALKCMPRQTMRAIEPDGTPIHTDKPYPVYIHQGAYIGDHATLVGKTTIGEWAIAAPYATLEHYIPPQALVTDKNLIRGFICKCENLLKPSIPVDQVTGDTIELYCETCGEKYNIKMYDYQKIFDPIKINKTKGESIITFLVKAGEITKARKEKEATEKNQTQMEIETKVETESIIAMEQDLPAENESEPEEPNTEEN